ncbi:MAG: hypothetical protein ABI968_03030, partial [Acidobacteriota bacterium]
MSIRSSGGKVGARANLPIGTWLAGGASAALAIFIFGGAASADPGSVSVARGRYLAHGVCECFECHSPLQNNDLVQPIASKLGAGDILDKEHRQVAPNITPDLETGA